MFHRGPGTSNIRAPIHDPIRPSAANLRFDGGKKGKENLEKFAKWTFGKFGKINIVEMNLKI